MKKGTGSRVKVVIEVKTPVTTAYQTWYSSQEDIGGNHINNEKGKGNWQVGEKQEDHTAKKQSK